jgi:L,D-transpeptidase catalytic domain/Sporulation and spore germination
MEKGTLKNVRTLSSLLAFSAVVGALAGPAGSAGTTPQRVYFTKGEQLGTVQRGSTLPAALRALVAGPTAAERAKGFRTEMPAGTTLRGVDVRGGVAFVDLSGRFESIQVRLDALGYLPAGSAEGLPRDGQPTTALRTRLATAERPAPSPRSGRRIEVSLQRQVALLVDANGVAVRTIHVSSGKASTPTPPGAFRVFRKELKSWSVPFQDWLPYASYFTGGIAFHEYGDVPTFAASHGCVRVPAPEAPGVYAFATLGTPVYVA